MTIPTEIQSTKYRKFMAHPLQEKAVEYLNLIVAAAGLDSNDLGVTWGVTVCTDTKSVLRVNVSNRYLADVIFSKSLPDGLALMCVIGEPQILGPKSMRVHNGFKNIKDSTVLTCNLGKDSNSLISENLVKSALLAHAQTSVRNLPNPNWHNPLTASLIEKPSVNPSDTSPTTLFSETKDPNSKIVKHVSQMLFLISNDDNLDQTEEDFLVEDFNKVALDLCDSMSIKVIEVGAEGFKVSIKLVCPASESGGSIIKIGNPSSAEIAEAQIQEHMAMMLFSFFSDPDESNDQKNEFVGDANEIAQILFDSMNIVVIKIQDDSTITTSLRLVDPIKFFEDIADKT